MTNEIMHVHYVPSLMEPVLKRDPLVMAPNDESFRRNSIGELELYLFRQYYGERYVTFAGKGSENYFVLFCLDDSSETVCQGPPIQYYGGIGNPAQGDDWNSLANIYCPPGGLNFPKNAGGYNIHNFEFEGARLDLIALPDYKLIFLNRDGKGEVLVPLDVKHHQLRVEGIGDSVKIRGSEQAEDFLRKYRDSFRLF